MFCWWDGPGTDKFSSLGESFLDRPAKAFKRRETSLLEVVPDLSQGGLITLLTMFLLVPVLRGEVEESWLQSRWDDAGPGFAIRLDGLVTKGSVTGCSTGSRVCQLNIFSTAHTGISAHQGTTCTRPPEHSESPTVFVLRGIPRGSIWTTTIATTTAMYYYYYQERNTCIYTTVPLI